MRVHRDAKARCSEFVRKTRSHFGRFSGISAALPFAKKTSLALLKRTYVSRAQAAVQIPSAFEKYYKETYAAVYSQRGAEIARSAQGVLAIYNRNIFPDMNVTWGIYPVNVGHTDFP